MKTNPKVILLSLLSLSAFSVLAVDNPTNDKLTAMAPSDQAQSLGQLLNSSNITCEEPSRSFFQGLNNTDGTAYWDVACSDGKSYAIVIDATASGNTKILDCSVMKSQANIDCFVKLAQ